MHRRRRTSALGASVSSAGTSIPDMPLGPTAGELTAAHEATVQALAESEARYRLIADRTTDVVVETDAQWRITWISPSIHSVLGWRPDDVVGRVALDVVAPADLAAAGAFREQVAASENASTVECRLLTADGGERWVALHAQAIRWSSGEIRGIVGGFRDCQAEVLFRRAATTLAATNAILVRATDEPGLLSSMCDAAVARGGYRSSWYGRAQGEDAVRFVAHSGAVETLLGTLVQRYGSKLLGGGPTGQVARSGVTQVSGSPRDHPEYEPWGSVMADLDVESAITVPVFVDGVSDGALTVCAAEHDAFDADAVQVIEDLASQVGAGLSRLRAAAKLTRSLRDQALFMAAIDQSAEMIVITDPDSSIIYANPAASVASGYRFDEMIGKNPRMFQSGLHDRAFYEAMWGRLLGGQSFRGVMVNRRKSGEIYEEEATITPVHDAEGSLLAYVGVKHDLTHQRELEAAVTREQVDRGMVVDIMRQVRPTDSIEATAAALCQAITRLDDIDGAIVLFLHPSGVVMPLGMLPPHVTPEVLQVGKGVPLADTERLVEVSSAGPWWADLADRTGPAGLFPEVSDLMQSLGFTATGYVPIRWEGEMVGVLSVATQSPSANEWFASRLGVIEELGTFAGMLLGESAARMVVQERERGLLRRVIDESQFHPVFQPVLDLISGDVVGYEALTRFDDGVRPDLRFATAFEVGLGSELESVCAALALGEAQALPPDAWLSVNFSPSTVIDGTAAATIASTSRQIVIEITEHIEIESYSAVRRAIAACAPARLAVDDAGAGFASLRHILELEPDVVKLDIALVSGIDHDPARQALVAGLCHFASRIGAMLIAEGVEEPGELEVLRDLGVGHVQGYLIGRPARVDAFAAGA